MVVAVAVVERMRRESSKWCVGLNRASYIKASASYESKTQTKEKLFIGYSLFMPSHVYAVIFKIGLLGAGVSSDSVTEYVISKKESVTHL